MTNSRIGQLFKDGRLDDAIEAAGHAVRGAPADLSLRLLLAELLLFVGAFDRVETVLVAAEAADPSGDLVVAEFRQLLRAAIARREVFGEGRLPEFLGAPTTAQTHILKALVALRAGDAATARAAAEAAEAERVPASGTGNGAPFSDFRDADDLCSLSFEVLTTTGKYYWVPIERVASLEFPPPRRPRDLFWRRCVMSVRDGPDGEVYLPALYEAKIAEQAAEVRLGRGTAWSDDDPVRGAGQRIFLAGDEALPIMAIESLEFA